MNNGHEETRLDRIERAMEALVRSQSHLLEAPTQVEREQKHLLTAQILMSDQITVTSNQIAKLGVTVETLAAETKARFTDVAGRMAETTDKLNALIEIVDRHLREHRGEQ